MRCIWLIVAVAAFAAAATPACSSQGVRSLTFVNASNYRVSIDVSNGDGARTPLVTLDADERDTVDEVADQGDTWVFRFESGGVDAGALRLTHDELEDDDWTVQVPSSVTTRLRAANVSPSA